MNILYLTLGIIRDDKHTDINSSLMREFVKQGHDVYIISPVERREQKKISHRDYGRFHLHFANIGNYFNTPWIEKGLTTVFLKRSYVKVVTDELTHIDFDLVIYSTPPVTFSGVIQYLRKHYSLNTFLLLKDVWPQSMVDMRILNKKGLQGIVYRYFEIKEKQLYRCSDYIGCMSPACAKYLLKHNRYIRRKQVSVCPNALNFDDEWNQIELTKEERAKIRKRNGIPIDKTVFVFGGNIGKGHDPDFLERCIELNENRNDTFIMFVGKGVYYERIKTYINTKNVRNADIIGYLPQQEYVRLMAACDVGMVTLDHRFTCPNYPSRILSYLVDKKPIIVAQDKASDVGPIAEKNGYGYYCESTNPERFVKLMGKYIDEERRIEMGERGYAYLHNYYNTKKVYDTMMSSLKGVIG